jgi:hypothetical protein
MSDPRPVHGVHASGRRFAAAAAAALATAIGVSAAHADPLPPQIHTLAGGGSCTGALTSGGACDGVPATSVPIDEARAVSPLPGGGFLYVDEGDDLIREVSPAGTVTTVAGNGTASDAPDGTPATQSGLDDPVSVAALPSGGFLVTEFAGSVVRLVSSDDPTTATITTIAGNGTAGDNNGVVDVSGAATSIELNDPTDAEPTSDGDILIADTYNDAVRLLRPASTGWTLTTIAGGGGCHDVGTDCDGMPAGAVSLDHPASISPIQGGAGGYLIAEYDGDAVREVSAVSAQGTFTTVAGTPGHPGYAGDGGPATQALLDQPKQVAATPGGGFLIADTDNEVIREVSAAGTISTVAGNGQATYAGDGDAATAGSLMEPSGVAPTPDGGFLIADDDNGRIRAVTIPPTTTITLSPATPNGNNGWYDTPVLVTVTAVRAVDTRCTADPAAAPTVYQEIPDSCPYSGPGADIGAGGQHTIYAASADAAGDDELPIGASLKVDATPPTVTCAAEPSFLIGSAGSVTAAVTDAVSGPATPTVSGAAHTKHIGTQSVTVTGANNAGGTASVKCPYKVYALRFDPAPTVNWTITDAGGSKGSAPGPGGAQTYSTVRRLLVTGVPTGAVVKLKCRGSGCPVRSVVCSARRCRRAGRGKFDLAPLLARGRLLPGAQLTVMVTRARTIARVWVLTIRRGRPGYRATCEAPGSDVVGKDC